MDTFCLFNPKKLDLQTLRLSVRPSYRSESDVLCGKTPECGEETNNTGKVVGQLVRTFCSICKAVLVGLKKKTRFTRQKALNTAHWSDQNRP